MKISVLGCGRWGSFIAWYLSLKDETVLWGREGSEKLEELKNTRTNSIVTLSDRVTVTSDIDEALKNDTIVISIASQQLRSFAKTLSEKVTDKKRFILCMKGLEEESGKRLSEVFTEEFTKPCDLAIWVGPGHVQDFVQAIPNCMLIDSENEDFKKEIAEKLSSSLIRFYYGNDLIGSEIGSASKNVIGIAAGMLDGFSLSSLKGALMARGAGEISRLISKMGGNGYSAFGLCHLGDYQATVFSEHSHNRAFGEAFVKGEDYELLAEGVGTCRALMKLSEKYDVELPICQAVYEIIFENADPQKTLDNLFTRDIKSEF